MSLRVSSCQECRTRICPQRSRRRSAQGALRSVALERKAGLEHCGEWQEVQPLARVVRRFAERSDAGGVGSDPIVYVSRPLACMV